MPFGLLHFLSKFLRFTAKLKKNKKIEKQATKPCFLILCPDTQDTG